MTDKSMLLWVRLMVVGPGVARLVVVMLKRPRTALGLGPAGRGPHRVNFKRRPAVPRPRPRLRLASLGPVPDLPHGHGHGRVAAAAAVRALELCPVVNCGPPLNTPPINSSAVPKEEPSHTSGDSSQGLTPGLLISTPSGIDPPINVLSTSAYCEPLMSTATDQQTSQWLQKHRFGAHLRIFNSFCGADLLRLSRDDLIQICGLADGIRLFNALHAKSLTPALTLYLTPAPDMKEGIFRALYLNSLTCGELSIRIAAHVGLSPDQISEVFIEGPSGIRVLVTDDVVQHMNNEGLYIVEVCQDRAREHFCLLLKPTTK
ncbi:Transcription factor CP2 [Frankliniella fusca]|uniref:Transcription factor CP2 n=1 Tax=Frankliniella fusca TaxID=407009 RepID=A0AAE1HUJ7_9NEOP|nr:Transcription factor CP2 [Frankliniella fusca]